MSSVTAIIDAFDLFFTSLRRAEFRKSFVFTEWSEQELLPLVRTFLLGYFGPKANPEHWTTLPGAVTGWGRFDFMINNIAVEFAVRRPWCPKGDVLPSVNAGEVKKLLKHDGRGVLILFDFSAKPLQRDELERYRNLPSLGRGPHFKSPFSVAYFSMKEGPRRLDIRTG
ncbi:MAG TPA: hypothetical protein VE891_07215 [Allosphingosinicella sp.]|nr:hypothetical protein [Allosphingosinicella sp.]